MGIILNIPLFKGSLIEEVSGVACTEAAAGEFKKSEKGWALYRGQYHVPFAFDLSQDWSLELVVRDTGANSTFSGWIFSVNNTTTPDNAGGFGITSGRFRARDVDSTNITYYFNDDIDKGVWKHLLITHSSRVVNVYIDNKFDVTGTATAVLKTPTYAILADAFIGKKGGSVTMWDEVLDQTSRDELYGQFLLGYPNSVPKKDVYIAPVADNNTGVVAHYNMQKSPDNVLVDISGNSNIGTIYGAMQVNNGLKFDGDARVSLNNDFVQTGDLSISFKASKVGNGRYLQMGTKTHVYSSATSIRITRDNIATYATSGGVLPSTAKVTITITSTSAGITNFYINGSLAGTPDQSISISAGSTTSWIGYALNSTYHTGEIDDVIFSNTVWTATQAAAYHNSFRLATLIETFENSAIGTFPRGWQLISGAFTIKETTTFKYLECTSTGVVKIPFNHPTAVDALIDFYNASWATLSDSLADLITDESWLSLADGYLTLSLTAGQAFTNLIIYNQVRQ